jgi:hypothetical protein
MEGDLLGLAPRASVSRPVGLAHANSIGMLEPKARAERRPGVPTKSPDARGKRERNHLRSHQVATARLSTMIARKAGNLSWRKGHPQTKKGPPVRTRRAFQVGRFQWGGNAGYLVALQA